MKLLYSVSTSGTYVAVVSWSGPGGPWHPIAAVSHDTHWSMRMVLDSLEINMHVRLEDAVSSDMFDDIARRVLII